MELPAALVNSSYSQRSSVVHTETNSVIETDHGKFLLVIKKLDERVICCAINSIRYGKTVDSQMEIREEDQPAITPQDLPVLDHISFVNCASLFEINIASFYEKINQSIFKPVGHLGETAMAHVLRAGQKCRVLRKYQQDYFK